MTTASPPPPLVRPASPWGPATPRAWQRAALSAVRGAIAEGVRRPLVQATTGSGKARLIAAIAALTPGPVLVSTPTQALTEQLAATVQEHTPGVGRCFQHAWEIDRRVVVTCAASLPRVLAERPTWRRWIADEAHLRLPVIPETPDAVGLTATPFTGHGVWERVVYTYTSTDAVRDGALVELRAVRWDGATRGLDGQALLDAVCVEWAREAGTRGLISAGSVADAEAFAPLVGGLAIHGYLTRAERERRIALLRDEAVPCLVHVQLLTTGVDFPFLRWLCLRRPVSSPVRLVQEVGRVLRAAPGKGHAVVYDPHNALGTVGLVHAAQLDAVLAAAPVPEVEEWEIPELEGLDDLAALPAPVAVSRLEGWASDLRASLLAAGYALRERPPEEGREWRSAAATPQQRARLEGLIGRAVGRLPERFREPFRWLLRRGDLRRGAAQDALDVLAAVWRRWQAERERTGRPFWRLPEALVPEVPADVADNEAATGGESRESGEEGA